MVNKVKNQSLISTFTSGEPLNQTVRRTVNFDRYAIEIELSLDGKFVSIVSIKVQKSFIESMKGGQASDVHDVDEYYNEE